MAKPIETVFRDFSTDGNPSTAPHEPVKADIRDLHNAHLVALTGATSGAIIKSSLSDLNGDLAHDADTMAWVVGDSTQGNDGVYQKQGASGAGSWTRLKDLPYSVIQLNNSNAGTANAIQATTAVNVPDAAYGALLVLNITAANTGAVTLSVNGETAKPVVTNTNAAITSGYFVAGMAVLCIDDGTSYRLMSYGDASAIQASAEAAATAAQNSATQAAASLAAAGLPSDLTGQAGKLLEVNGTEDGYDFTDGASNLTRGDTSRPIVEILRDTPPSISDFGGTGDGVTDDTTSIRNCLDTYGVCYLPYFMPGTYTAADWYFGSEVALNDGQRVIGSKQKPTVKQSAVDNLFVIKGNNTGVENLFIDQSATTLRDISQSTFFIDTSVKSLNAIEIKNIDAGIERDLTTLVNGYDFMVDSGHASNIIVDLLVEDVNVWGSKGYPYYLRDVFAAIYFKKCTVEWTRQTDVPVYPGWTVIGGEGIFWDESVVQGVGTTGVGNSASHGWSISGGAAFGFRNTRADVCGGRGYSIVGANGIEMVMPIGSLCGEEQFVFDGVNNLKLLSAYAGGRSGQAWSPTLKAGVWLLNSTGQSITDIKATLNTGSGIYVQNSNSTSITGGIAQSNVRYGVEEGGTSNYNGVTGMQFLSNTINNGYFTGSASYVNGIMRNSGVGLGYNVPGAATAW